MTNIEASTTTQTAAVAEGATIALEKASLKGSSPKKGAPTGQKAGTRRKQVAKTPKAKGAATNKKAEVIPMLQRKGGATLDDIVKATGWQRQTVRRFISILGSKAG